MNELTHTQFSILKSVAKGHDTASSISKTTDISLPYVTTQLALLEAKGIIRPFSKASQSRPGKPKKQYQLAHSLISITVLRDGFGVKTTLEQEAPAFERYLQLIPQISPRKREAFSTYYWTHRKYLDHVQSIGHLKTSNNKIELVALTTEEQLDTLRKEISNETVKDSTGKDIIIACWIHTPKELVNGYKAGDEYYKRLVDNITVMLDDKDTFPDIMEKVIQ
ncbi:MAG: hypothetical protein ACLFTH_04265 [Candidatus Woesearchaeota archaeon]